MPNKSRKGAAYVEFAISLLVLIPLLLGTIGIGLNMHMQLQTVQLARDAGHMFARNIDFTLLGNQQVLSTVAGSLNLSTTAGKGNSVVILSTVQYMDLNACTLAGMASGGQPSGCTNYQKWVFTKRLVIGNSSIHSSNLGTPPASIVAADGSITIVNQATSTGAVAAVNGFNPWNSTNSTGLPSGQIVFVAEAAATGFHMPPYTQSTTTYAQTYF